MVLVHSSNVSQCNCKYFHCVSLETDVCVCDISQRPLTSYFSRLSEAVLVLYDVTNLRSFEEAQKLVFSEQQRQTIVMLIANKSDCVAERVVATESGR
jgi:GTPase SAR1 family protein